LVVCVSFFGWRRAKRIFVKADAQVARGWNGLPSKGAPAEAASPWGVTLPETFEIAGTRMVDRMSPALAQVGGEDQRTGDESPPVIRPV